MNITITITRLRSISISLTDNMIHDSIFDASAQHLSVHVVPMEFFYKILKRMCE